MRGLAFLVVAGLMVACGSGGGTDASAVDASADGFTPVDASTDAENPCQGWTVENVAPAALTAVRLGLALDGAGRPNVVYYANTGTVMLAVREGAMWTTTPVTTIGVGIFSKEASITFDGDGRTHVAWTADVAIEYATRAGAGAWAIETIESSIDADSVALEIGPDDTPRVAYSDFDQGTRYARRDIGGWVREWAAMDPLLDGTVSLAVGADDRVHIAVYEADNRDPWYLTNGSGSWQAEVVDSVGHSGLNLAIELGQDGVLRYAYDDDLAGNLRLAMGQQGSWETDVLDGEPGVGSFLSIALSNDDTLHAAYVDLSNQVLYGRGSVGAWTRELVDTPTTTAGVRLALGTDGTPHIVYQDGESVRYARRCGP